MIWPYSHDGKYNCKSSYKFLKEELDLFSSQQPSSHDKQLCKGIWSLHVPQKNKELTMASLSKCHASKGELDVPSLKTHGVTADSVTQKILPMRYGHVRNLILFRLTRNYGVYEAQSNFRISRKLFHG
nr:hypothetical protein CFP56_41208 [Quercus suber]